MKINKERILNDKKDEGIELLKKGLGVLRLDLEKKDVLEFNDQNYDEMCTLLQYCKKVRNRIRDLTLEIKNIEENKKMTESNKFELFGKEYRLWNKHIQLKEATKLLKEGLKSLKLMLEEKDCLKENYNEINILLKHCQIVMDMTRDITLEIKNIEEEDKDAE